MAFVLAQTLRHGAAEGAKVALVPLLTDSPILLIVLLTLRPLAALHPLLGGLSLAGSAYLLYLAVTTWRSRPAATASEPDAAPRSFRRGILVNLLNPNPWIFWFTVGTPTLVAAWRSGWPAAVAFLAIFWSLLVGCQVAVALVAARSRAHIAGRWFRWTMRTLALLLAAFAAMLARDGLRLLG